MLKDVGFSTQAPNSHNIHRWKGKLHQAFSAFHGYFELVLHWKSTYAYICVVGVSNYTSTQSLPWGLRFCFKVLHLLEKCIHRYSLICWHALILKAFEWSSITEGLSMERLTIEITSGLQLNNILWVFNRLGRNLDYKI